MLSTRLASWMAGRNLHYGWLVAASNVGNDTDSIATMAGAIAGAWKGFDALPKEQYAFFNSVNSHDFNLPEMATGLTKLAMESLKG